MASVELVSFACRLSQLQPQPQPACPPPLYSLVPPMPPPCQPAASAPGQCQAHPCCSCGLVSLPGKLVKKLLMQLLPTECRVRERQGQRQGEGEWEERSKRSSSGWPTTCRSLQTHSQTHTRTQHSQCTHGTKVLPTLRRKQKFLLTCAKAAATAAEAAAAEPEAHTMLTMFN